MVSLNTHMAKSRLLHAFSQPPPPSSRPPVTGYKIFHNITGSAVVIQTSDRTFIIEGVLPGVYFFTVLAVNTLGNGKEETIFIVGKTNSTVQLVYFATV